MAPEKVTKLYQGLATVDKKIEVRRTRSDGEKPIVVLDPCYPTEGLRINNSTDSKIFNFDVHNGQLELWGTDGNHVSKQTGTLSTGINGGGALLTLKDNDGHSSIRASGGGREISLYSSVNTSSASIRLDGESGLIHASNADLAENFACTQDHDNDINSEGYGYITDPIEPGDVLVISGDGTLVKCEGEYDTRVAGVVSGAKDYKPAIVLDEFALPGTEENYPGSGVFPVALAGKVFCKVNGEVKTGDLLVTSPKKGVAMRADPRAREKWTGAILGKALGPTNPKGFREAYQLIPILVMLG